MDQNQIDEVLERNNIVDVIGSYFPLKKAGSNYKARCPFHDEKTASFVVSEKKQIFKCFGCGKAGNVITFVRDYEKISFLEALKKLASRAGLTIQQTKVNKQKQTKRDLIYKIYSIAVNYYQENLQQHGTFAKKYLEDRKISDATIKKFQIGYALDSFGGLKNYLLKNSINEQILQNTGLFTANNNDLFKERLMFPIHDHNGKVIAFGGRVLREDQTGGKYVNSPTTDIYTKGNELYGLFVTRYEISKKDFVIVCEGYTDFLRLYENDFTNSVASLGTSLTDSQVSLLGRYTNNFYMIYDGDKAGRKAAVRAASNIIKKGYSAKIATLPETDDPDSFLLKNSRELLQKIISDAKPLSLFLLEDEILGLDKKAKLNELIETLNEIEDEISRELMVKEISEIFKVSEHAIISKIRKRRPRRDGITNNATLVKVSEEKDILTMILNDKLKYKKVAQEIDSSYFFTEIYKIIYSLLLECFEGMGQASGLLEKVDDKIIQNTIAELIIEDPPEISIEDAINNLKLRKLQRELVQINELIENDSKNMELFSRKKELKKQILKINKKVVRKTLY
ncbi:MAG: DNA primase [Candidatus Cloacimonetes bacterium]|nr:DNA primase [Candidatus Cloacimonadota bacterium]